jgi:ABC-type transport system involved in multi-copper enzyme maturation permease subunit
MGLLRDISLWLWRLLPANPILVRVVSGGGRRRRHMWARCLYLAVLFVVIIVVGGGMLTTSGSLATLAKKSTQTFMWVSVVQLFLMAFIAPVFTAAAITQEKDANTYHILLTTPLTNGQIVLGSLMSRLYFVWVLLLSGLPIFCITMVYGGVTTAEVFQSFALAGCTGLVTGSLAITISVLRVGTRRTIFAFFLGVAVYLLAIGAFGYSHYGWLAEAPIGTSQRAMSWVAPLHPFLALLVVTGQTPAPPPSDVYHYGWPWWWLLAYPQYGYLTLTTLASMIMILVSLFFVRRGAKEGEATIFTRIRDFFVRRPQNGQLRKKPRRVWRNPIAWREAATRASAGGRSTLRWAFAVGGIVAGVILLIAYLSNWWGLPTKALVTQSRSWLTAIVWIELAVILLLVTNTAATTLTREKESLTMELLLSTPLTSDYIIAGMLQGLVRFVVPLIAVPTLTLVLFVVADFFRSPGRAAVAPLEAALLVPALMIAFAALAAMVGLQFSLLSKKTVQAVMISTAIVMGAAGLLWGCGMVMGQASPYVAGVVLPFTPFPAVQALIDPSSVFDSTSTPSVADVTKVRVARFITSLISVAVYAAITYSLYKNMVRSFDMTVRRQSA